MGNYCTTEMLDKISYCLVKNNFTSWMNVISLLNKGAKVPLL